MNIIKNILEISLLSSVLIVVVLVLRTIWKSKINYKILSLLWILVLVRLITPYTFDSPIHFDSLFPQEKAEAPITVESIAAEPMDTNDDISPTYNITNIDTDNEEVTAPINNSPTSETVQITLRDKLISYTKAIDLWIIALIIWLCGAVFVFILNISEYLQFSLMIKKDIHLLNPRLSAILNKYKAVLDIKTDIIIFECKYVSTPVTFRCFKPVILMPRKMTRLIDEKKLNMIVLHELCHIKRRDILKNFIWLFSKAIHWFNPLVWIAYKRYISDIELFCDDMVLKYISEDESFEYSQSLIDVIKLSSTNNKVPVALSFCEDKTKIKERVQNMIEPKKKLKSASIISLIIAVIMIVACFTTACMKEETAEITQVQTDLADENNVTNTVEAEPVSTETAVIQQEKTTPFNNSWVEVGTEQKAIEIAQGLNISNADSFTYEELYSGVLPTHRVDANDSTDTMYFIYDFNGEFLNVDIDTNYNENKATITEQEAQNKAIEYIKNIYGDVEVTIDECNLSRDTFFEINGSIYKESENSTRTLDMCVNGQGEFCSIRAKYDAMYVYGLGEEVKNEVLKYSQDENVDVVFESMDYLDSQLIYTFFLSSTDQPTVNEQSVKLLASDYSLIEYSSGLGATKEKIQLDDDEFASLIKKYLDKYYPAYSGLSIESIQSTYSEAYVLMPIPSTDNYVSMSIYADGSLKSIKIVAADTLNQGDSSTTDTEIEAVLAAIPNVGYPVLIDKEYEFVRKYADMDQENVNIYEFTYYVDEPSVWDYPFVLQLYHYVDDNRYRAKINPIVEELNILSEDEAIEIAKKIVADEENIPESKLECVYKRLEVNQILTYAFDFEYDNTQYGVMLYPDTGLELYGEDEAIVRQWN